MSSLLKIRSERDQMSAIERRIADFLLENAHLLRDYSSQQLADALRISQSSVVKFSQKLGFKGYPDLKFSVGEEIARETPREADNRLTVLSAVFAYVKSKGRIARNPRQPDVPIVVPERDLPAFTPGKEFRHQVLGNNSG